jgi:anti-sigma B factor antagonist
VEIKTNEANGIAFVYMSGRLTSSTSGQAYDELVRVAQSGTRKMVINVRDLDFIASSGLRSILVAAKLLKGSDGEIRICEANPTVKKIFETSGFDSLIRLCADEKEALASFEP